MKYFLIAILFVLIPFQTFAQATSSNNGIPNNTGTVGGNGAGQVNTGTVGGGQVNTGVHTAQPVPKLTNPLQSDDIKGILGIIVDLALNVGIILAVLMIIYAGFRFVWARGNATELAAARQLFMYVIIGLAVLIAARAIVGIIQNTLIQANVVKPG
jgi:hypothetical protein